MTPRLPHEPCPYNQRVKKKEGNWNDDNDGYYDDRNYDDDDNECGAADT